MNVLSTEQRVRVVRCLVEGCSIRATVRMTGVSKNTIVKLLRDLGIACAKAQSDLFQNLPCRRLQLDEIWCFVGAKEKNTTPETKANGWGDAWTWTAICADTKLIPSWMIGARDLETAKDFVNDLAPRLKHRAQITSDGLRAYVEAVDGAFAGDVDYAQLVKVYGVEQLSGEQRYSPAKCLGSRIGTTIGEPDAKHISTSYVERANLTMRMNMRRFTRLTNAFSKKVENLAYAVAIHFAHYNLCRVHQTLRVTPAMEAGLTDHVWEVEELVALLSN